MPAKKVKKSEVLVAKSEVLVAKSDVLDFSKYAKKDGMIDLVELGVKLADDEEYRAEFMKANGLLQDVLKSYQGKVNAEKKILRDKVKAVNDMKKKEMLVEKAKLLFGDDDEEEDYSVKSLEELSKLVKDYLDKVKEDKLKVKEDKANAKREKEEKKKEKLESELSKYVEKMDYVPESEGLSIDQLVYLHKRCKMISDLVGMENLPEYDQEEVKDEELLEMWNRWRLLKQVVKFMPELDYNSEKTNDELDIMLNRYKVLKQLSNVEIVLEYDCEMTIDELTDLYKSKKL